jgi:predicted nucleotidyltransferase
MRMIVKMKFGAHLYGTATSDSDLDYKGIFLPTKEELLLGRVPKSRNYSTGKDNSRNTKNDIDTELYSLHYFIKLACDGQTVAMDMLHAPKSMILRKSKIWDEIVENKQKFYTKNLKSFIDYARRQASKYGIKGSRINAALQVLEILKKEDPSKKMRRVWRRLPRIEHCYDVAPDPNGMRQYQVIYVHSIDWYLTIADKRDVIEIPFDGDLDINGWDIRKSLKLLRKSNSPLLEWLSSPIKYRNVRPVRTRQRRTGQKHSQKDELCPNCARQGQIFPNISKRNQKYGLKIPVLRPGA